MHNVKQKYHLKCTQDITSCLISCDATLLNFNMFISTVTEGKLIEKNNTGLIMAQEKMSFCKSTEDKIFFKDFSLDGRSPDYFAM